MIALLQRVSQAKVEIAGDTVAEIGRGLLVLLAVEKNDTEAVARRMLERITGYRVFADEAGKMNLSVKDIGGGLLLVPQFTLAADTNKGMRPSFSGAAAPEFGKELFQRLVTLAKQALSNVSSGQFGADMQVSLTNDGPVTFWLRCQNK